MEDENIKDEMKWKKKESILLLSVWSHVAIKEERNLCLLSEMDQGEKLRDDRPASLLLHNKSP